MKTMKEMKEMKEMKKTRGGAEAQRGRIHEDEGGFHGGECQRRVHTLWQSEGGGYQRYHDPHYRNTMPHYLPHTHWTLPAAPHYTTTHYDRDMGLHECYVAAPTHSLEPFTYSPR